MGKKLDQIKFPCAAAQVDMLIYWYNSMLVVLKSIGFPDYFKTFLFLDQSAKTDELFEIIKEKTGIPIDELRLIYGAKQLEKGRYVTDYNVQDNSTLFLVVRLKGGMDENHKQLDDDVELTYEPDMITWDDDPDNLRAKMPCGHAIGKELRILQQECYLYTNTWLHH